MTFFERYLSETAQISQLIDREVIRSLLGELKALRNRSGRLFILGVGGSSANASHACNDFRKLANIESYSPTESVSELTARTNDEGWEEVFVSWLRGSRFNSSDAILVLSVGGGDLERKVSVNICKAVEYARELDSKILAIVGRPNGYTQERADVCLVIPQVNSELITPHSESFQSVIWHLLVSHPELQENKTKW